MSLIQLSVLNPFPPTLNQIDSLPLPLIKATSVVLNFDCARQIVSAILKDGPITIDGTKSFEGQSKWNSTKRILFISKDEIEKPDNNLYRIVSHLMFELFNALKDYMFEELEKKAVKKKIDKEIFVKEIERIEFQSHNNTKKLLGMAVKSGHLTEPDLLEDVPIIEDFDTHYKYHQLIGHTERYAKRFDTLSKAEQHIPICGAWKVLPGKSSRPIFEQLLYLRHLFLSPTVINKEDVQQKIGRLVNMYLEELSSEDPEADIFFIALTEIFTWQEIFNWVYKSKYPLEDVPAISKKSLFVQKRSDLLELEKTKLNILALKNEIGYSPECNKSCNLSKIGIFLNLYLSEHLLSDPEANDFFLKLRNCLTWQEIFNSVLNERHAMFEISSNISKRAALKVVSGKRTIAEAVCMSDDSVASSASKPVAAAVLMSSASAVMSGKGPIAEAVCMSADSVVTTATKPVAKAAKKKFYTSSEHPS